MTALIITRLDYPTRQTQFHKKHCRLLALHLLSTQGGTGTPTTQPDKHTFMDPKRSCMDTRGGTTVSGWVKISFWSSRTIFLRAHLVPFK